MKRTMHYFISIVFGCLLSAGCNKGFLDKKPNTNILIPETLESFRQLLDASQNNTNSPLPVFNITPALQFVGSDEFYIADAYWQSSPAPDRNAYIWAADIYEGDESIESSWNNPYTQIFYVNVILNGINNIPVTKENATEWKFIKGWALLYRAWANYNLAETYAPPYDEHTANTDLGIPIRLSANIDEIAQRASVRQTYDRIIADMKESISLLNIDLPTNFRNRPSKQAAYGLLARMYLNMRKYDQSEVYADSCLALKKTLIDYNTVDSMAFAPFSSTNPESLLFSTIEDRSWAYASLSSQVNIDSNLLKTYEPNDLRRKIYFKLNTTNQVVRGRAYQGNITKHYTGVALDEIYLVKAECLARNNQLPQAIQVLNDLLIKRYKTNLFTPVGIGSQEAILSRILLERRKELVMRGLRWSDLRRLNKEGMNIIPVRKVKDQVYSIQPNSPRYTYPIPAYETRLSGITQNIRP